MYSFILDVAMALIFVFFIYIGFKKGFIKSLISLTGALIAFFLATYISAPVSKVVYEGVIEPPMIKKIENSLKVSNSNTADEIFESIPTFISNALSDYGVTKESVQAIIVSNSTETIPQKITNLFALVVTNTLEIIFTAILFSAIMVLVTFFGKTISKVFKVPVLRQIDGVLGIMLNIIKCYLFLIVAVLCLKVCLNSTTKLPKIFLQENINSTVVFKHFYEYDFLKSMPKI